MAIEYEDFLLIHGLMLLNLSLKESKGHQFIEEKNMWKYKI